jgi:hypothetical protein
MMREVSNAISGLLLIALMVITDVMLVACREVRNPASELYLVESQNTEAVPRYGILELSFQHNGTYENKFFDVDLTAVFVSPDGTEHHIRGFFYGGDLWKVRFRPDRLGIWNYTYTFASTGGFRRQASGVFRCLTSDEDGPVQRNPENPFRWVFANGRPFFPVGLEDCVFIRGSQLLGVQIDGKDRQHPGPRITWDEYFSIYGQAGFNLFRFSQKNCSYSLVDDLDHYRKAESILTDELLSLANKHGFRVMFGFFGIHGNWPSDNGAVRVLKRTMNKVFGIQEEALWTPDDRELIGKEERFIDYCIARWGVYADFWELLNEREASDQWTTVMAEHVHSVDPDHKPISTSWEKPDLPVIDINAPHWYESESELSSDLRVQQEAVKWKQTGKPVIVGEQGNSGMNWDPVSAVRMRIRLWTALFQEISFVFWNTSWTKAGMFGGHYSPGLDANIYLGPEERGYVRVLQDFASRLDIDVRMIPITVSSPALVHAYGLASKNVIAVYLQHAASHTTPVQSAEIRFDLTPRSGAQFVGEWIDPATGDVLSRVNIPSRPSFLLVPPFKVDVALLLNVRAVKHPMHP